MGWKGRRRPDQAGSRLKRGGVELGMPPARWAWGGGAAAGPRAAGGAGAPRQLPAALLPLRGGSCGRGASPRREEADRSQWGAAGAARQCSAAGAEAGSAANGRPRSPCARARGGEVEGGRGAANRSGARARACRGGRGAANGERRAQPRAGRCGAGGGGRGGAALRAVGRGQGRGPAPSSPQ